MMIQKLIIFILQEEQDVQLKQARSIFSVIIKNR